MGMDYSSFGFLIAVLSPYLGYLADNKKSFSKNFLSHLFKLLLFYLSCFGLLQKI